MAEIYGLWIHINRWILTFFHFHFISTDFLILIGNGKMLIIKLNKFYNHNINKFALKSAFNHLFHHIIKKKLKLFFFK